MPKVSIAAELRAVADAEATLAAAEAASGTIEDRQTEARQRLIALSRQVNDAAAAVVADETTEKLLATAVRARDEFLSAARALRWLNGRGLLQNAPAARVIAGHLDVVSSFWQGAPDAATLDHGAARVIAATEVLKVNPAAALDF